MTYAKRFWSECDRYHDLAKRYDQGIETYHPNRVTSKRMCVCLDYCNWCGWAASTVTYYRYNGERV